jgi:hypothetical protein
MLGAGAAFSTVMTVFRYTNGLRGIASAETDEEEVERRERMKKTRRRPLSETIAELGEGRGGHAMTLFENCADLDRNLRAWLRRATTTEAVGEVRCRRHGSAVGGLNTSICLGVCLSRKCGCLCMRTSINLLEAFPGSVR